MLLILRQNKCSSSGDDDSGDERGKGQEQKTSERLRDIEREKPLYLSLFIPSLVVLFCQALPPSPCIVAC